MSERTLDHGLIEELIVLRALGGLEPGDTERLEREQVGHGPSCPGCLRLEREYADVAGALAAALDPVLVREGLEDEVVAAATGRDARGSERRTTVDRGAFLRRLSTLATAAALVLGGWVLRGLTVAEPEGPSPAFLANATLVRFEGSGAGSLAVAYRADRLGGFLLGSGLPALAEGERYELWLFEGEVPTSGGCFAPEDGTVVVPLDGDVGSADLLAVTVEAAACPDAPTTEPILVADPATV